MTASEMLSRQMTEAELQRAVMELARLRSWLTYHTWRSVHSPAGFPDCVLVRPPRLIFAELKRQDGKLSADQTRWLAQLAAVADAPGCNRIKHIEVYCWRPNDWRNGSIEEALR